MSHLLATAPMDIDAAFQDAFAAHKDGRFEDAEAAYAAIVAVAEHPLSLHNLGVLRDEAGRIEDAGDLYRRAAAAAPGFAQAAFDLGCVILAQGRLDEGWPLYENRAGRARMLARDWPVPEWRGEPLGGKRLYVWREQGFGDQILAARFLLHLDAAQVSYAGRAPLRRLFAPLPVDFVEARPEGPDPTGHDYWTLPLSLPRWRAASAQPLPSPPYLSGRPKAAGGRIGVVTRGEPGNPNDRVRALPRDSAERLLALPGAISLDPADTGAKDFQDTADIIAGLDLVISADTAVAHLAGALGRPTWVLLARHALDWQWPRLGASAWYPSARMFVQRQAGDWGPVVDEVLAELGT